MRNEPADTLDAIDAALQLQVGSSIRRLRETRGLTQEHLAHSAGLATRHLQKIEAGQVNVTLRTIGRLCLALEIEASALFLRQDSGG